MVNETDITLDDLIKEVENAKIEKREYHRARSIRYYHDNHEKVQAKRQSFRRENKDEVNKKKRDKYRANKVKAVEYLGGKCKRCDNQYPTVAYDFHHRDPKQKDNQLIEILGYTWERVVIELDKCDLLCANCHRIVHEG